MSAQRLKTCWSPYYKQYGPTINGWIAVYKVFYFRNIKNYDALLQANEAIEKWPKIWDEKRKYMFHCSYRTAIMNRLWYQLEKDLKYSMKPLVTELKKYGYRVRDSYILGSITITKPVPKNENPLNPDASHWATLYYDGRLVFQGQKTQKVYHVGVNFSIEKAVRYIDKWFRAQTTQEGLIGRLRMEYRMFTFEVIPIYKKIYHQYAHPEEYYYDWNEIPEQYFIRRLKKKCNIILKNSQDPEEHFMRLKDKLHKKPTVYDCRVEYITYSDLENEAWLRDEDLTEDNLEEIFYSLI